MANTINDVYNKLTKIGENIAKMGGTIQSANKSYSLQELADGVLTVPTYTVTGGSQAIQVWEMPATTISVYDTSDTLIGSGTTNATTGGMVNVNISTSGTYRVTAVKNGSQIWTKQVSVNGGQVTVCKTPLTLDDYTEDEIEASCQNHYAHHMFSVGDYRTESSFMGSTSTSYTKKYILGFNCKELVSGGYAEILWGFLGGTPSTYKIDTTNHNGWSWEGCEMRQRCLPSGSTYYRYDSTVTDSTEGTYYTYDYENKTWVAKTLPADYSATASYYTLNTTASDGAFYTGALSSSVLAHAKAVKNLTWAGFTKDNETSTTTRRNSTRLIETEDLLFLPSCYEYFGEAVIDSVAANGYWCYNKNEGSLSGMAKENKAMLSMPSKTLWFRSPTCYSATYWCCWNSSYGYVTYYSVTTSYAALLCYAQ